MKKILCVLLCLCLCLSFSACGKNTDADGGNKTTIDDYAAKGEVPELRVKLGTAPQDAINDYELAATEQNNEDLKLYKTEGQTAVNLSNGQHSFYYEKAREGDGISVIAITGGTAFGLDLAHNTTQSDVESKLSAKFTMSTPTADQLYFLPGAVDGGELMSCTLGDVSLKFFFFDGYLSAVTLTNTVFWAE